MTFHIIGDEQDRAAAEHFPSQDDMDAAMEDFLKQLEQELTMHTLCSLLDKIPNPRFQRQDKFPKTRFQIKNWRQRCG